MKVTAKEILQADGGVMPINIKALQNILNIHDIVTGKQIGRAHV